MSSTMQELFWKYLEGELPEGEELVIDRDFSNRGIVNVARGIRLGLPLQFDFQTQYATFRIPGSTGHFDSFGQVEPWKDRKPGQVAEKMLRYMRAALPKEET